MPVMKQRVTEMAFGREISDRGETDGRRKKKSQYSYVIHMFQFVFFSCVSLILFPLLSLLSFSASHLLRFKYLIENICSYFFICRNA